MNRRERQMLVHSYLYYEKDKPIIRDHVFDAWAHELYDLMQEHPEEFQLTAFYELFLEFNGSTGMNLQYRLPWVIDVAEHLLRRK